MYFAAEYSSASYIIYTKNRSLDMRETKLEGMASTMLTVVAFYKVVNKILKGGDVIKSREY